MLEQFPVPTPAWMRMASAVVDQPLADAILLAGKEFPGRIARMLARC
ncbi:MAG: hypothetical protein K9L32_01015 [Chromatiaceae bacterium]|nr:hypothetical protein [Chromatiaceae bacterium]MCF8002786.1 hypothetical protein [Chromatiaceae bacterium]